MAAVERNVVSVPKPGARTKSKGAQEDQRLLDLFWNRAELKKEFTGLQADRDHLMERIKEQQRHIVDLQHQIKSMENIFAEPESGYNAIVFFQLRSLWEACYMQMTKFVKELKKQQEDRERLKQVMEFNQERQARLQAASQRILQVKKTSDDAQERIAAVATELESLKGFWNFLKRREVQRMHTEESGHLAKIRASMEELFDQRIKIESEPWPEYPGLSTGGKRAINIAMIAMAQHLFLFLSEHSLATKARAAKYEYVGDAHYGPKSDCEYLMGVIAKAISAMKAERGYGEELKTRSEAIRKQAKFRTERDAIPTPESVGIIETEYGSGIAGVPLEVNVLSENYWDLDQVLVT